MINMRIAALHALFQYTGLSNGDLDDVISPEVLHDPSNPIVSAILFIYSLDTFLPESINKASRE